MSKLYRGLKRNLFLYYKITQSPILKKKIQSLLTFPFEITKYDPHKKESIPTKTILERLWSKVQGNQNLANLKTVDLKLTNHLLRNDTYWIVRVYIRIKLGLMDQVISEMLKWEFKKALRFFSELEIYPNSQEWKLFEKYFNLKQNFEPELANTLGKRNKT